jgi:hypothetical protein
VDRSHSQFAWRKSPYCGSSACVEVAKVDATYAIRDSKNPDGPFLAFTQPEWDAFVSGVRDGHFTFD